MFSRNLCALFFALAFGTSLVSAQVGQKDGAPLPATDPDRIKAGQPAPDFTLENYDGNNFTLSDFRGKKNVVLVFYRGHW